MKNITELCCYFPRPMHTGFKRHNLMRPLAYVNICERKTICNNAEKNENTEKMDSHLKHVTESKK